MSSPLDRFRAPARSGTRAIGPRLHGLAQPVHDLSRGCPTDDRPDAMAATAAQALERGGDA